MKAKALTLADLAKPVPDRSINEATLGVRSGYQHDEMVHRKNGKPSKPDGCTPNRIDPGFSPAAISNQMVPPREIWDASLFHDQWHAPLLLVQNKLLCLRPPGNRPRWRA